MIRRTLLGGGACLLGAVLTMQVGCASPAMDRAALYNGPRPSRRFSEISLADWSEDEPAYRLYPGDVLEITAPSAPELSRTVTVQPDGRIALPLVPPVMAADRTLLEMQAALSRAYARQLLRPQIEIAVKQAAPLKIFVGGEVRAPGVYDMPGDIDALRGVILAGGFLPGARREEVVVIRRSPDGRAMMRTVDLRRAVFRPSAGGEVALRRFDIVYVPKTSIAELDQFVDQYLRQAIPVQFSYAVGPNYVTAP
jgi:polysaccharide export outer membrane protein